MAYKKQPFGQRRYLHFDTGQYPSNAFDENTNPTEKAVEIPLPNEIETAPDIVAVKKSNRGFPLLENLKTRIHMEDIILLGLIFLLLDENIEDDFLLIMLIYILVL